MPPGQRPRRAFGCGDATCMDCGRPGPARQPATRRGVLGPAHVGRSVGSVTDFSCPIQQYAHRGVPQGHLGAARLAAEPGLLLASRPLETFQVAERVRVEMDERGSG